MDGLAIGQGVGSDVTVLILALSTILLVWKVKEGRKEEKDKAKILQAKSWATVTTVGMLGKRMIITLQELEKATNNFDISHELGGGGHGTVYKGILSSQHVVAIKKANIVIQKEINEFIVAVLSQVNHRNIVKLLGCCHETEVPLLVYEFISNGTLYKLLHVESPRSISWQDRLRIAIEAARALSYLHSFISMPIVRRDIKSPNILLDDNLTVKLSDFGASRYIPIDQEGIRTSVQGTLGYLDPIYGVLLIELLTRKKPVSYRSSQGFDLSTPGREPRGNLDPQVAEGGGEVVDVALLAAMCVKSRGEERPAIRQVEIILQSIQVSKEIAPVLVPQLLVLAAAPIGLPGCNTRCGGVVVPYPFGIGAHCSLLGFNLTCDSSHNPPRLQLLGDSNPPMTKLQVTRIYLNNATIYAAANAAAMLNHTFNPAKHANATWALLGRRQGGSHGPLLVLSHDHNRFVVLGCNIQAKLFHNTSLITACSSFCMRDNDKHRHREIVWEPTSTATATAANAPATAAATLKSRATTTSHTMLSSREWHKEDVDQMTQNLVVIAEVGWIETVWCWIVRGVHLQSTIGNRRRMIKWPDLAVVPMVLEFAMNSTRSARPGDNWTRCPTQAESDCKSSHSSCIDINNAFHRGYVCQCLQGYHGNPYLVDGCQDSYPCYGECINLPGTYECRCIRGSHGNASMMHGCVKSSAGLAIGLGVGSGMTVLVLAISTILLARKVKEERKRKLRQRFFKQNRGQLLQQLVCQRADIEERMIISLQELEKATNNFDKSRELGGGGHGTVYKGILSSQHVVAIKKAKIVIQEEIDEFINEVNHRNIVKLLGCCLETEAPLLVYEFISNGTLYKHLHVEAPSSISWKDRSRIAVGIARALTYLHTFVSTLVVRRDIKSPNILLDDNLTVKLSDFGASRYIPIDQEGLYTSVQGT
ncbi:LOW QUALITY PROTEIN: hypothetical protein U9M48_002468 [Paspalum notatum var. saurae]|uniref:Protein kinase domain-containing protein n=1 Tax=Paspalum notatum var. saurae TaxID=547442 RepID=A0AAQ3PH78_PASNO